MEFKNRFSDDFEPRSYQENTSDRQRKQTESAAKPCRLHSVTTTQIESYVDDAGKQVTHTHSTTQSIRIE